MDSGVYLLEIYLSKTVTFPGRFDNIKFPKGYYYYAGSAQKNLSKRVERHFRKDKIIHWHIDNLTSHKNSSILNTTLFYYKPKDYECILVQELFNNFNLNVPVKGFGNSDCKKCESHLLFTKSKLLLEFLTL